MNAPIDLARVGDEEKEYFIKGVATRFVTGSPNPAAPIGEMPYETRIVIRRPTNPQRSAGVVVVDAFGPPPSGTPGILKISADGKEAIPVPGSEGMVAADGMGLDSATGYLYVTDIFGSAIWRVAPGGGSAQLWTSVATNPLLGDPDGVKVFNNAVYTSSGDRILRIPIDPDGSAGTATIWAEVTGAVFDDMVLDDRTGDVYVTRLDTDELLQITPGGVVTPIATNADGLLGAANMTLIHAGMSTVIYLANSGMPIFSSNTTGLGPALLKITIT